MGQLRLGMGGNSQVIKGGALAAPVPDLAIDGQRLIVARPSQRIRTLVNGDSTQGAQIVRLDLARAGLPGEGRGSLQLGLGRRVLPQPP